MHGQRNKPYHFGRLGTGDVELEVGILLPVAKEQRELEEEAVVGVAESRQSLGTRVPIETAFEALAGSDQLLPIFEIVGIGFLRTRPDVSDVFRKRTGSPQSQRARQLTSSALSRLISAFSSSEPPKLVKSPIAASGEPARLRRRCVKNS